MPMFYAANTGETEGILSEDESWHCVEVLRMHAGDPIRMTDGLGNLYLGVISELNARACRVHIGSKSTDPSPGYRVHIAIAPTKSADRFEWFLEKATETGADEITPLICDHSERTVVNPRRLEKILISAMKQSLRSRLPILNNATRFSDLAEKPFDGQKFIAYCGAGDEPELGLRYKPGQSGLVLIGPEGDFSPEEIGKAVSSGFLPVSLGPSRLRTETAGVVACHTLTLLNRLTR